jgi:hypothetical protein
MGEGFIQQYLKGLGRDDLEKALEYFASPIGIAIHNQLVRRLQELLLSIAMLENCDEMVLNHVRTQTVALVSTFLAMNREGLLATQGIHPLLQPKIEEDGLGEG